MLSVYSSTRTASGQLLPAAPRRPPHGRLPVRRARRCGGAGGAAAPAAARRRGGAGGRARHHARCRRPALAPVRIPQPRTLIPHPSIPYYYSTTCLLNFGLSPVRRPPWAPLRFSRRPHPFERPAARRVPPRAALAVSVRVFPLLRRPPRPPPEQGGAAAPAAALCARSPLWLRFSPASSACLLRTPARSPQIVCLLPPAALSLLALLPPRLAAACARALAR